MVTFEEAKAIALESFSDYDSFDERKDAYVFWDSKALGSIGGPGSPVAVMKETGVTYSYHLYLHRDTSLCWGSFGAAQQTEEGLLRRPMNLEWGHPSSFTNLEAAIKCALSYYSEYNHFLETLATYEFSEEPYKESEDGVGDPIVIVKETGEIVDSEEYWERENGALREGLL